MIIRILHRRDTTANWESINPILGTGELGIETLPDNSRKIKFGDGTRTWINLPYFTNNLEEFEGHINNDNAHNLTDLRNTVSMLATDILEINALRTDVDNNSSDIIDIKTDIQDINSKLNTIDIVSIKGSVDTFTDLPNPEDLIIGSAYIVEQDENKNNITTVYAVIDNAGNKEWEFIAEFKVDLTNYYTKDETDTKLEDYYTIDDIEDRMEEMANTVFANHYTKDETDNFINTTIRNNVNNQQNIISDLSMENNKIINVAMPIAGNDAANKQYVDTKSGNLDYSLTEQDTGKKWIDGRTIYQRTFTGTTPATGNVNNGFNIATMELTATLISVVQGYINYANNNYVNIPWFGNTFTINNSDMISIYKDGSYLKMLLNDGYTPNRFYNKPYVVTIQYIK